MNDLRHGQLIILRKDIRYNDLDVSRWTTDNMHLVADELLEQPVRNVINAYACNSTINEQDWIALDNLQTTLPGETIMCRDFNAGGGCSVG